MRKCGQYISLYFLRIRWSYYGIYATVSGIFFDTRFWQQLFSAPLILYIRDNSVLLDCAQHAIYQHTMANLDLFQMSLRSYLLFLKCLVARRCISCDLLQPYFHCFSYSLVPSFLSPATFQTSFQKL